MKLYQQNDVKQYPIEMFRKLEVVANSNEYLRFLERNDRLAIATSYEIGRRINLNSGMKIHCFDQLNGIYNYPLKILASKNFSLMNELNVFIQRSSSSGFIVKWLQGLKFERFAEKKRLFQYTEMNLENVYIPLAVWCSMILFVSLVFCIERIVHKKVHAKNTMKIWKHIEMAIDPHRHFLLDDFEFVNNHVNHRFEYLE